MSVRKFIIRATACAALAINAMVPVQAAPYAALVMDARTGKVLHARNADTKLHPASLTKMMTLYVAFQALERGEISLDQKVTISRNAANEPPSRLGLRAGSKVKIRYLVRAAAVKSANDAATALAEAISGSEAAFTKRMTRTARAMGMNSTTFRNAHGLTQSGHLSTARDMSVLGRHMIYDYDQYYNLFSRKSADAGIRTVRNTNTRLLNNYEGADGIKTGYTRAAGYNLVASAERGRERIIATVFGGRSTATRNARVAELLDMGFNRAPTWARVRKPRLPAYVAPSRVKPKTVQVAKAAKPKTQKIKVRPKKVVTAVKKSLRPIARPVAEVPVLVASNDAVKEAVLAAVQPVIDPTPIQAVVKVAATPQKKPQVRPAEIERVTVVAAAPTVAKAPTRIQVIPKLVPTEGDWAITVGKFPSKGQAERVLLRMALAESTTLIDASRKVKRRSSGYEALFTGLSGEMADLACRRLNAQNFTCLKISS